MDVIERFFLWQCPLGPLKRNPLPGWAIFPVPSGPSRDESPRGCVVGDAADRSQPIKFRAHPGPNFCAGSVYRRPIRLRQGPKKRALYKRANQIGPAVTNVRLWFFTTQSVRLWSSPVNNNNCFRIMLYINIISRKVSHHTVHPPSPYNS